MDKDAPLTLARDRRLRKRRDFLRVQKYGHRVFGRHVVVISQNIKDVGLGRIGITVPKKVGPAHERNLVKRRIRHVLRLNPLIFSKIHMVVIARESANGIAFATLAQDVLGACQKLPQKYRTPARSRPEVSKIP